MILEREQINRYLRHIIIPEISGPGQKRLLETTVYVYGENALDSSSLIYYLAASGIGQIFCYFEEKGGCEALFENVRDLNSNVSIELVNDRQIAQNPMDTDDKTTIEIVLGDAAFIAESVNDFINSGKTKKFIPIVVALKNQWRGAIQICRCMEDYSSFMNTLKEKYVSLKCHCKHSTDDAEGNILSACLLGAISAVEVVKLSLNIGENSGNALYFDILSMEFSKSDDRLEKLFKVGMDSSCCINSRGKKLSDCKVLIVGTGGLGSPAAYALTRAGIGTIGLVDYDRVEISNLNRQILHSTSRIGMPKVKSAETFLKRISQEVKLITYNDALNKENAVEIIKDYDVVIDGVDNFPTRYLLNDACYFAKKPMIEAGVLRFSGLGMTFIPGESTCYRCIMPDIPAAGGALSCSESGVLGPVPGVMGFIEAAEVIKLLTGKGSLLTNKLLYYEALDTEFFAVNLDKKHDCPLCGANPTIKTLQEYGAVCNNQ